MFVKPELVLDKPMRKHSLSQLGQKDQNNSHPVQQRKGLTCLHAFYAKTTAEVTCGNATPVCKGLIWRSRSVSAVCMSQHRLHEGGAGMEAMEKVTPAALLISQCLQIPLGVHSVLVVGELWNSVKFCWSNEISVVFCQSCGRNSSPPPRSDAFFLESCLDRFSPD